MLFLFLYIFLRSFQINKSEIKLFSPATVANVACGFDVLGLCLDTIGDEMVVRKVDGKGVRITKIEGFKLPFETELNVAGVSALAMYQELQPDCGFEIEIGDKSSGSALRALRKLSVEYEFIA